MITLCAASLADTRGIAAAVASLARSGDVIVLAGEMGSGKTAFAQGFGAALGVDEPITSPTFNLVHSHRAGRLTLLHADLYRLGSQHEVADLALAELVEADGVLLVEWGDVVASMFGDHLLVRLEWAEAHDDSDVVAESARRITMTMVGRSWVARNDRLRAAVEAWTC